MAALLRNCVEAAPDERVLEVGPTLAGGVVRGAAICPDGGPAPLPFPAGAFHVIVAPTALETSADPDRFLAEARRVLAPGGRLVLQVPTLSYREVAADLPARYAAAFGARRLFTRAALEERLGRGGFAVADWHYAFNSPLSHRLLRRALSDRLWGRPNEGHFLVVQATPARPGTCPVPGET